MIRGEAWYMIRELLRAEVAVSEIARRTGVDRKTIRRIRERDRHPAPQTRPSRRSGLDPFKPYLQERADAGVLNATKLYAEIQRQGYTGGVAVVRRFVHPLRPRVVVVTERFETPPGRQGQVDWTACGHLWHEGELRPLSAFVLTLGYSRRQYVEFTLRQDLETFLRCHVHAFQYFAGITHELLYDNLKTAVDHRQADGSVVWNQRFRDFADYYGFLPRACQPYRAQTKGKVERGIGYLKGNFLLGLDRTNLTLGALNGQVLGWLREIADVRIHGTTRERPIDRWPIDQAALLPLDRRPDYDTSYVCQRLVSREASVAYAGARYGVPAEHAGRLVLLKEAEDGRLRIYAGQHCIATHARAERPGPVTAPVAPPTRGPQPAPGADRLDAGAPVGVWPQVERRALSAYDTAAGIDGLGGA